MRKHLKENKELMSLKNSKDPNDYLIYRNLHHILKNQFQSIKKIYRK